MIYTLNGVLTSKQPTFIILDVNGVGYGVTVSAQTTAKLPEIGSTILLSIHHHITEIGQSLFGFFDLTEKSLFELLITVKGIGPKMGIAILSGMPAEQIKDTIAREDHNLLSKTPGIGKKTAERIILELKDKIQSINSSTQLAPDAAQFGLAQDAVSALESLGYRPFDASKQVQTLLKSGKIFKNASDLVREALKSLNA